MTSGNEQYQWVMPTRLADTTESVPDEVQELLGLTEVLDAARRCYDVRSLGHHFSPDALRSPEDRWIRSALGLAGSVAESIVVCAASEVEIELLRRSGERWVEISGRFFSIASSSELIGVGHRLVNLVARAVSARVAWHQLLVASKDRDVNAFAAIDDPRSSTRAAWLSLNEPTARQLAHALSSVEHDSVQLAAAELVGLATSHEWVRLVETRGDVFHRSRPESSIAAGVRRGAQGSFVHCTTRAALRSDTRFNRNPYGTQTVMNGGFTRRSQPTEHFAV